MELMQASTQWANRPKDQQFNSLQELHAACEAYRKISEEHVVLASELSVAVENGRPVLHTPRTAAAGKPVDFTHFSFGQISQMVGAPAAYLRTLPPSIAADCLNEGLGNRAKSQAKEQMKAYLAQNGHTELRAMTGTGYARIYDSELTARALDLEQYYPGVWAPAEPTFRTDGSSGKALWASDRDLFMFLVSDKRISPRGADLARGFFLWNSEVGDASIGGATFLYDNVCGNFIVWGARNVREFRFRHVGQGRNKAFREWAAQIESFSNSSTEDDLGRIATLQNHRLYATKEQLLDGLFRSIGVPKGTVEAAYEVVENTPRYGDPLSAWGMINGLTEVSQREAHTSDRVAIDLAAGKIAQRIVF